MELEKMYERLNIINEQLLILSGGKKELQYWISVEEQKEKPNVEVQDV